MDKLKRLWANAEGVIEHAHAPYSEHKVAAALYTQHDSIFTGVNVENSAYKVLHAEVCALGKAVSAGITHFSDILVVAYGPDGQKPAWPCGCCRQALAEFGDMDVHTVKNDEIVTHSLSALLPKRFEL